MWLINVATLKLESFLGSKTPDYAILSHTWEDEEVTFQEFDLKNTGLGKKGYKKISKMCGLARQHNIRYAWIDTCCIDKTSSAELTESINSMFRWYQDAQVCYAYLSDLPGTNRDPFGGARNCRWFTRGWTLQELIAPRKLVFFDQDWKRLGTKHQFAGFLCSFTGINQGVLVNQIRLEDCSVATRMSWAADRETTRIEDQAYCLFGIFKINMPLIYGEGPTAFQRLQEEIANRKNDLTLFAWDPDQHQVTQQSLFASSPSGFANSNLICRHIPHSVKPDFSMTNKGLMITEFKAIFKRLFKNHEAQVIFYLIRVGSRTMNNRQVFISIPLAKVGPDTFARNGSLLEDTPESWNGKNRALIASQPLCVSYDGLEDCISARNGREICLRIPRQEILIIKEVIPESHWDDVQQLYFSPPIGANYFMAVSCDVRVGKTQVNVVICIEERASGPSCRIFHAKHWPNEVKFIFTKIPGTYVTWNKATARMPSILEFKPTINVYDGGDVYTLSVKVEKGVVKNISKHQIHSLDLRLLKKDIKPDPPMQINKICSINEHCSNQKGPSHNANPCASCKKVLGL